MKVSTSGLNERPLMDCLALETPRSQLVHSRQGGWRLDEVADTEMSHVRDSFGTVVVPEFRNGFLAGVHSGAFAISAKDGGMRTLGGLGATALRLLV